MRACACAHVRVCVGASGGVRVGFRCWGGCGAGGVSGVCVCICLSVCVRECECVSVCVWKSVSV